MIQKLKKKKEHQIEKSYFSEMGFGNGYGCQGKVGEMINHVNGYLCQKRCQLNQKTGKGRGEGE